MMVTRTSSCQSDSSGFMEELPEPSVLQNASLSGKTSIFSDIYNQQTVLSHPTEFPLLNQDFQQNQNDCVGEVLITSCESILKVSRPTKACRDQGEEISLLVTAENAEHQACNTELQSLVQERLCGMEKKETKTERQRLEKEECTEENSLSFKGGTQDEGDPVSSKFHCQFYFSTGHKNMNTALTELRDTNPVVITERKLRSDDESERCMMEKDSGVTCLKNAHRDCTECGEELQWGVKAVIKNSAASEETNRQKFCKIHADAKNMRCFSKRALPETMCKGCSSPSCSSQVPCRPPLYQAEGPGFPPNDQEMRSTREMLDINKPELGDPVQNCEMTHIPLRSVTVQMPSGLDLTSKMKYTGQNVPCTESLARDDHVDLFKMLTHCSEGGSSVRSDPGAPEDSVKQTTDAPSQTGENRKTRKPPVLCPHHSYLTKSASFNTMLSDEQRPHHWKEASGVTGAPGSPCCHFCCCHGCCLWTCPVAASPHSPMGCCSNQAANKLQLLRTLMFLQENTVRNLPLCTHEIELMKISCQHFLEKLGEIEQHLSEQQTLFSNAMPEEGREESKNLQRLCQDVRQEVAELEFCLNDRAYQVGKGILMQLDQLLVEQSHLFSELGLSDWKGEKNAQNKQALPDAAGARSGCSEMVPQRAASKNTKAAGSFSAPHPGAPSKPLPTRKVPEPNSANLDLREPSIHKKEIKGPPQTHTDFKAFIHNLKKSF